MNSYENLIATSNRLKLLRRLKGNVDPASGLSITIRLGPVNQENDTPVQSVTFETGNHLKEIFELAIQTQKESLVFWRHAVRRDMDAGFAALKSTEND